MVNLLWKFHRLPCTSSNRRSAACEGVGGIQYTHAQTAKRSWEGGEAPICGLGIPAHSTSHTLRAVMGIGFASSRAT
jgi:hypothetical protein